MAADGVEFDSVAAWWGAAAAESGGGIAMGGRAAVLVERSATTGSAWREGRREQCPSRVAGGATEVESGEGEAAWWCG